MDRETWKSIQKVLDKVLDLPPQEIETAVKKLCSNDSRIEAEVLALLRAMHKSDSLLDQVAVPDLPLPDAQTTVLVDKARFAHYTALEKIAVGGMGVVYKALDPRLGRQVALKFLSPQFSQDKGCRDRFFTEAKAISKIDHPNVCLILDIAETTDGVLYFSMPFYEGQTLRERLRSANLSRLESLGYLIQVCDGLSAAHAQNVVHRDIKPSNILITNEGIAKILDFGIAKMADGELTQTGQTVGTYNYMAPEQLLGEATDRRADVWSLGVVFYELMSGSLPFTGESNIAVSQAILNRRMQPLEAVAPDLPQVAADIVSKALSGDPEQRYGSMDDLLPDLQAMRDVCPAEAANRTPQGKPLGANASPVQRPGHLQHSAAPNATSYDKSRSITPLQLSIGACLVVILVALGMIMGLQERELSILEGGSAGPAPTIRGVYDDRIVLGMSGAFSGASRDIVRNMQVGMLSRFSEVNAQGGVHGRKLFLHTLDDRYDPGIAQQNLNFFMNPSTGVFALIGNVGTPATESIFPAIHENETLLFGALSGSQKLHTEPPDPYVFNYRPSYRAEVKVLLTLLRDEFGIQGDGLGVVYADNAVGREVLDKVREELAAQGYDGELSSAGFPSNSAQVDEAVAHFNRTKDQLDGILIVGTYRASALFTKLIRDAGYKGRIANLSIVGGLELAEEFKELGPHYGAGVIVTQVVPNYRSFQPGVVRFRSTLNEYYPSQQPSYMSLEGYIVASIFVEALQQAGRNVDTDSLIRTLQSMQNVSLDFGIPLSFSPTNHTASHRVWPTRLNAEGVYKPLGPPIVTRETPNLTEVDS
ncbi:MAG: ABC transporter substrate-binding protein [Pseudomonadota bacterium]